MSCPLLLWFRSDLMAIPTIPNMIEFMHKFINLTPLIRISVHLVRSRCVLHYIWCEPHAVNHVHISIIYHQMFDDYRNGFCILRDNMNVLWMNRTPHGSVGLSLSLPRSEHCENRSNLLVFG